MMIARQVYMHQVGGEPAGRGGHSSAHDFCPDAVECPMLDVR